MACILAFLCYSSRSSQEGRANDTDDPTSEHRSCYYAATLQDQQRSPNSIDRRLAAIRWWARRLSDLAHEDTTMSREQREEITLQAARVAAVGDVRGQRPQKGRHISTGELDTLMTACANDQTTTGTRDAAIIALAWVTGARRPELAGLTTEDWTQTGPDEGDLTIRR